MKVRTYLYLTRDDGMGQHDEEVKVWIKRPRPADPTDPVMTDDFDGEPVDCFWVGETHGSAAPYTLSLSECADLFGCVPDPGSMKVLPVGDLAPKGDAEKLMLAARKYRSAILKVLKCFREQQTGFLQDAAADACKVLRASLSGEEDRPLPTRAEIRSAMEPRLQVLKEAEDCRPLVDYVYDLLKAFR